MTTPQSIVQSLAELPASDRLFNPYSPADDQAAGARRHNLTRYLQQMQTLGAHVLMLAEAPGYRGCAVTGIPVTSERVMLPGIEKWELFGEGYRQVSDEEGGMAEMSATILWGTLAEVAAHPPLIWNTCPLHPHKAGNRQSNRRPLKGEQRMGHPFIEAVLDLYDIQQVLAVGRVAEANLAELGVECRYIRHPAQGGKAEFVDGIREVLG